MTFICTSLQTACGNVAEDTFVIHLWCVFQAQGVLQEYLLAMTTDEQLLNHTAMVRLYILFFLFVHNTFIFLRQTLSAYLRSFHRLPDVYESSENWSLHPEVWSYYTTLFLNHAVWLIEWSWVSVSQLTARVSYSESPSCWHPAVPSVPLFWMRVGCT